MKKTRQTTADTPRASREPSMKWIAGAIYTIVFTVAALLGIAQRLAWTHGGGIEAEVRGNGIARQVACTRDRASLGTGWTCRAEDITWENRGKLPDRVLPQKAPYTVLATGDWRPERTRIPRHQPPADGLADPGQPAFPATRRNPSRPRSPGRRLRLVDGASIPPAACHRAADYPHRGHPDPPRQIAHRMLIDPTECVQKSPLMRAF